MEKRLFETGYQVQVSGVKQLVGSVSLFYTWT